MAGDLAQPAGGGHLAVRARAVGRRLPGRPEQLHAGEAGQVPEVAHLEGLHDQRPAPVHRLQRGQERLLQRQPERAEVAGVLELRHQADRPAELALQIGPQRDDLGERDDPAAAVVARAAHGGQPLAGAQRAQLGQREVLGEPLVRERHPVDDLRRAAAGELRVAGDVGRPADRRLVADDQRVVARGHQVGLDEVGAQPGGQPVGLERVLGPVAGRPAVAVDQGRGVSRSD
jgi:hypothetical protein